MARNGSQRLPTAPYDYKHTLLLFSSSMTPTDFQRLPSRELTPQPYSKAGELPVGPYREDELAEGARHFVRLDPDQQRHPGG